MKLLVYTILIIVFIAILAWFNKCADIPIVYWSNSKNECVKVIIKGIDCDCKQLPDKYERIWVK